MIIYSALYNTFYPFDLFYPNAEKVYLKPGELPSRKDGFLILWGGGDIHPTWYNRNNVASDVWEKPTIRDQQEVRMAAKAIELGLPILGVCRGAQLSCALAGGILIQHVSGHGSEHYIRTKEDTRLMTSSMHHQMMYPWTTKHELIAWSEPGHSHVYRGLSEDELKKIPTMKDGGPIEPEVVYFNDIKSLAVQGHPEFMEEDSPFNIYLEKLMEKYGLSSHTIT